MTIRPADPHARRIEHLSQRTRRVVAVATLLGLPVMFVWSSFWTTTTVPTILWGPITFVLIGISIVGSFILYRYIHGRADLGDAQLDERERHLRDRAWILSYQVLSGVVIAVVVVAGVTVLGFGKPLLIDASLVNAVVLSVAILLPILPAAALAWIEPDAPAGV